MPSFLSNIFFYGLFLITFFTFANVLKRTWSPEVINKDPKALATNNTLILFVLALLVVMLFTFGWLALILMLTSCFVLWMYVSHKVVRHMEDKILKDALARQNETPQNK